MSTTDKQPDPAQRVKRPLWLRLLGIRRRNGRFLRFGLTRWGWALAILVVLGGGMAGMAEYTMQPDFCRSCHIMEPYYEAWHGSKHHNVPCADCHFDPGLKNTLRGKWQASAQAVKYLTNTYGSKPHAEIHDASCLREGCHDKGILEGQVKHWKVPNYDVTIRFNHAPHLQPGRRGQQLRCVSCHSQLVQGQHIVVTLDTCFLCHFKGLKHGRYEETLGGCKACHDAPKEKVKLTNGYFNHSDYISRGVTCENCHSDSVKGDGAVPRQVCWNCHNQPNQIARYGEVQAMHAAHVSLHKVECSGCHVSIEHRLSAASEMTLAQPLGHPAMNSGACGQCHEQTHAGPAELYRGVGGRGVPDMPSPMSRTRVGCLACHKSRELPEQKAEVVGQTFRAVQESCDYCHGKKYAGTLDQWKKTIAAHQAGAEAAYAKAKAALDKASLNPEDLLKAKKLLDDAEHNIRLVKLGHGVHNVNYSTALLNVATDDSAKVVQMLAPSTQPAKAGVSP
jgi:nitrate/TMAO reductase-like tetraheme cytochrome c subunit